MFICINLIAEDHYLGQFRQIQMASDLYWNMHKSSLLGDYVQIHMDLGLALKVGRAVILSPLDAHKDHELFIIAEEADDDWISAYYIAIQTLLFQLRIPCWSSGMAWPPVKDIKTNQGLPAVAKIGTRGNCQSMMSDVSSFELYMYYNVNTNPYATIRAVKEALADEELRLEIGL